MLGSISTAWSAPSTQTPLRTTRKIYRTHIAPVFGSRPVAGITTPEVTALRAKLLAPYHRRHGRAKATTPPSLRLVTRSPKTVKHIVGTLKRILDVAQDDQAIPANSVVAGRHRTTKRSGTPFKHRPLSANQVAAVFDWIANDQVMIREARTRQARRAAPTPGQGTPCTRWPCCRHAGHTA